MVWLGVQGAVLNWGCSANIPAPIKINTRLIRDTQIIGNLSFNFQYYSG